METYSKICLSLELETATVKRWEYRLRVTVKKNSTRGLFGEGQFVYSSKADTDKAAAGTSAVAGRSIHDQG